MHTRYNSIRKPRCRSLVPKQFTMPMIRSLIQHGFFQSFRWWESAHFFIRNSFIRNLYWDGQIAKKLSVLMPQRLKNLQFFFSFSYHNFEDTMTNFDEDVFRKESFCGTNS